MEGKLLRNILKDYNRKARPVLKESDVVHISMDIALPQLMKIVSKNLPLTFCCLQFYAFGIIFISVGNGDDHILGGAPREFLKAREHGALKFLVRGYYLRWSLFLPTTAKLRKLFKTAGFNYF